MSCTDCGYDPCECEVGYGPVSVDEPPATVRVRIAVAVDEHGTSYATDSEEDALDNFDWLSGHRHVVWVEADVPLPLAPQTVQGQFTASAEET